MSHYYWDGPLLFRLCSDGMYRRCVPESEIPQILVHCHSFPIGGHARIIKTAAKIHEVGFFWLTFHIDVNAYVKSCDSYQRVGNISRRHEMPLNNIL